MSTQLTDGGINAAVMPPVIEVSHGKQISVVSPPVVEEAMEEHHAPRSRDCEPVLAARAALAYAKASMGHRRDGVIESCRVGGRACWRRLTSSVG